MKMGSLFDDPGIILKTETFVINIFIEIIHLFLIKIMNKLFHGILSYKNKMSFKNYITF